MNNTKEEKWGYIRETQKGVEKAGIDPDTGLHRTSLIDYLKVIYPDKEWIHDKCIGILNGKKCRYRPDYRNEELQIIIEFDGLKHYQDPNQIKTDIIRNREYEEGGYRVIRIPYFIQLSNSAIKTLFGIDVAEPMFNEEYPSLGIKNKNTPAYLCPLGVKRMAEEFAKFPNQYSVNILELKEQNNPLLTGVDFLEREYESVKSKIENGTD